MRCLPPVCVSRAATRAGGGSRVRSRVQMRLSPRSPVRMRTTSSTGMTKILPSPMRPVLAAFSIASTTLRDLVVRHDDLELHLGHEVDHVRGAAVDLGLALLPAEALHLGDGHALDADLAERLSFTSSSLNGLMIASTFFMRSSAVVNFAGLGLVDPGAFVVTIADLLGRLIRLPMVIIRIDNEPELKIEDAMQVKGRGPCRIARRGSGTDHESRSRTAA